jgi:Iron-containing redox enzyme
MTAFMVAPPGRIASDLANGLALNDYIRAYAGSEIFHSRNMPWEEDNPYRRPLLPGDFVGLSTETPIPLAGIRSNASLVANRLLMSIYERDFVFLPANNLNDKWNDFQAYYGDELRLPGELIRSRLEPYVFSSVEAEFSSSGRWTLDSFEAYFEDFRNTFTAPSNATLMSLITGAENPVAAAQTYLIQLAGDFLVESSAMARNAIGNYGQLQSELFKVIIDECGYGVHPTRHSTLFQKVLVSRGLNPIPHTYWEFYLPSSFYLNNYYSYICRDHRHLFRYFGAILQVETAFGVTCRQMAEMMHAVFGPDAEVQYFLEHVHIDNHHSRMVFEEIVVPAVRTYGTSILGDILRGFEESRIVGDVFGAGLMLQIAWGDSFFSPQAGKSAERSAPIRVVPIVERGLSGRWTGTRMSGDGAQLSVKSGELDVVAGYGICATFGPGQTVPIPPNVLYAACPSADCIYEVDLAA